MAFKRLLHRKDTRPRENPCGVPRRETRDERHYEERGSPETRDTTRKGGKRHAAIMHRGVRACMIQTSMRFQQHVPQLEDAFLLLKGRRPPNKHFPFEPLGVKNARPFPTLSSFHFHFHFQFHFHFHSSSSYHFRAPATSKRPPRRSI